MNALRTIRALISFCLAASLLSGVASQAQDAAPAPVAQVDVEDVSALAVSGDGALLFALADGAQTLRVFSLEANSMLGDIASVPLDAPATALAAASNYAVITADTGDQADTLLTIGEDPFNTSSYTPLNFVEIPNGSRSVTVSQDSRWAVVAGQRWYSIIQMISATDLVDYPASAQMETATVGGVVGSGVALITQTDPPQVIQYLLRSNQSPRPARRLELDAEPRLLTVNGRQTTGAVALDSTIVLFDTATMEALGTVDTPSSIAQMQFSPREQGEWLAVALEGERQVRLYDVTDRTQIGEIGSLPLEIEPIHLVIDAGRLVVTDGSQLQVFEGF